MVKADPALSGRILSFVNSAAFGARRPIACIEDAAMMMGIQRIRNFALGLSLVDNSKGNSHSFNYALYWSQSLAMAVASATIAALEPTAAPEEAFTLGLLSDIGSLALATAWPDVYSEDMVHAQGDLRLQMERERFSIDHHALCLLLLADC